MMPLISAERLDVLETRSKLLTDAQQENVRLRAIAEAADTYYEMFKRSRENPYTVSNELKVLFEELDKWRGES